MPNIRSLDMKVVDDLFDMGGGYVLDFSDRTISIFFAEELNIDIDDPLYQQNGTSKAKRLRCFLQTVDMPTVLRTLERLWEYREALRMRRGTEDTVPNAQGQYLTLIHKLSGKAPPTKPGEPPKLAHIGPKLKELRNELLALSAMEPHPRGYAFEKFLRRLSDVHGLKARDPFSLRGEQIDGSFELDHEIYLLEAKWENAKTAAADLRNFQGKIESRAGWARGLFVSNSGFTQEGLDSFGRGKRVICMDGLDLYEMLERELPFDEVLKRKMRHAAETGECFAPIRDLFQK